MTRRVAGAVVLIVLATACGTPKEPRPSGEIKQDAGQTPSGVEPVSVQALMALLPELSGWIREQPQGERATGDCAFSSAQAVCRKGDVTLDAKITDAGMNQALFAPFIVKMASGYSHATARGWEKSFKIDDNPGLETWDKKSRTGGIDLIVGHRYLLQIDGRNRDDIAPVRTLARGTDLATLAALK